MNIAKVGRGIFFSLFVVVSAASAQTETIDYVLENITLQDGHQITGTFSWTYVIGDIEDGNGEFSELSIPHTAYSFEDGNLEIDIQPNSIEITGNGDFHDMGLDITMVLEEPFTSANSVPIDLNLSFFECCGNGFHDQTFINGAIAQDNSSILGDVNLDGSINLLDVAPFVALLSSGAFQTEADINVDGSVGRCSICRVTQWWIACVRRQTR